MAPNFKAGAPTSVSDDNARQLESKAQSPNIEQTHVRYGQIKEVTPKNFVKVVLLDEDGNPDSDLIAGGTALPVTTAMSFIVSQFGPLRPGLICKVTWKGLEEPSAASVIEIIGDEEHELLKKQPYPEEIAIGPWKIFAGGMIPA